jgi:hypothetical protein
MDRRPAIDGVLNASGACSEKSQHHRGSEPRSRGNPGRGAAAATAAPPVTQLTSVPSTDPSASSRSVHCFLTASAALLLVSLVCASATALFRGPFAVNQAAMIEPSGHCNRSDLGAVAVRTEDSTPPSHGLGVAPASRVRASRNPEPRFPLTRPANSQADRAPEARHSSRCRCRCRAGACLACGPRRALRNCSSWRSCPR